MKIGATEAKEKKESMDSAVQRTRELYEANKGKPQYTPEEINALYPRLNENSPMQALRRIANEQESMTEEDMHIVRVVRLVEAMKSQEVSDCWARARYAFKGESPDQIRQYIIDILRLWCTPVDTGMVNKALRDLRADVSMESKFSYQGELYENYDILTPENLDARISSMNSRIESLTKKLEGGYSARIEDEISAMKTTIQIATQIKCVLLKNFTQLWKEVRQFYEGALLTENDVVARVVDLYRVWCPY